MLIDKSLQVMNGLKKTSETEFEIMSVASGTQDNEIVIGTGKGINFENPYITEEQVTDIYNRIVGYKYLPCEITWRGNPASESGDVVKVEDMKSNTYRALICSQSLNLGGGFSSEVKSVGVTDAEIQFDNSSPIQNKIKQTYTRLQEAIVEASALINGAKGGIFRLTDSDGDGINDGWILADRQDEILPPNTKCITANYEGIGWSKDGGRTYKTAITHDGIIADAITTGLLKSADEQTYINLDTGEAQFKGNLVQTNGDIEFSINPYDDNEGDNHYKGFSIQAGYPHEGNWCTLNFQIKEGRTDLVLDGYTIDIDATTLNLWAYKSLNIQSYNTIDIAAPTLNIQSDNPITIDSEKTFIEGNLICEGTALVSQSHCDYLYVSGDGYPTYAAYFNGNVYATGEITQGSLKELKKNFEKINSTLDIVKSGDIYSYNYKTEKDEDKKHFGFVIGDEFDTPEEVISKSNDGIDTYSMCSILWKAVQELTEKVENLENKLNNQKGN